MDVLELPRPVINFLRNMAKEGTRYALSWDIFGGEDSVTLTLTWKLVDEPLTMKNEMGLPSNPFLNESSLPLADHSSSSAAARRSRRDECQTLARPVRRRAKSNLNQGQTSSFEGTSPLSSDPTIVRSNATQRPSPSHTSARTQTVVSSSTPPAQSTSLSLDRSQRRPSLRSSKSNRNNRSPTTTTTQLRRFNDERDENPWVQRFEAAMESTQGKVKFKSQPDYF